VHLLASALEPAHRFLPIMEACILRARARSSQSEPMMRRGRGIGFEKRGYRKLYQLKTWPFVGLPRCSEISEAERTAEVAHGKRRQ
jgi:hypothetical protein